MRNFNQQIEALNQRGGRILGIVDLIEANTLDAELAAYLWQKIDEGASFLTAARPGGAGKSTVLANMLNLLPAGTSIHTVASGRDLAGDIKTGTCYLAHEIGSGPYFAYLWGSDAGGFFERAARGARVASCLHADTLEEVESILTQPPNLVSGQAFAAIGLLVFIHIDHTDNIRRRVGTVYEHDGRQHRLAWQWDATADTYHPCNDIAPDAERISAIKGLVRRNVRDLRQARSLLVE
jgi:hypothetical protein